MPLALQYIGYVFPFALPTTAFRAIIVKDLTIYNPTVYMAFLILSLWCVVQLALCFWFVQDKKRK
jgi:hypothetical protein